MASLLGKRRNPFASESSFAHQPKQSKPDMQYIYDRTMNLLMGSAERQRTAVDRQNPLYSPPDTPVDTYDSLARDALSGQCYVCSRICSNSAIACHFCSNICCTTCARPCDHCQHLYCAFCSTNNYDMRYDRIFCLNCNQEEQMRARRQHQAQLQAQQDHWHNSAAAAGNDMQVD